MSSRPSFSLGRAISAAITSLPAAWRGAWAVLILSWAAGSVPQLVSGTEMHLAANGFAEPGIAVVFGMIILMCLLQLMTSGALYRTALFGTSARKEGLGFGGLQFGLPELRLFAAELIVALFMTLIVVTVVVVFAIAFNTAGMAEGHPDTLTALGAMLQRHQGMDWLFIGYMVAAWFFLIFVSLKFSLMRAATVAERRIVTLNALGLSSGNVGKLFMGLILLTLPFLILSLLVSVLLPLPSGGELLSSPGFIGHMALKAAVTLLLMPLLIGFLSSAYRQITASRAK